MEESLFRVHVDRTLESLIVRVSGELDFAKASELEIILRTELQTPARHLILDFHEVTFLDSEGLKVLVRAYRQIDESGGRISVVGCSRTIGRLFDILGLRGVLGVESPGS